MENLSDFEFNPLFGITIGSTVDTTTSSSVNLRGRFQPSVIKSPFSVMMLQEESQTFMSGQSNYVHSDKMNQGSGGLSGAYGAGIGLFKSAISAYGGKSSAVSSKTVVTNYTAISVCGREYIDFEQFTAGEFFAGLSDACQQAAEQVLDDYIAVTEKLSNLKITKIETIYNDEKKYKDVIDSIQKWIESSKKFTQRYKDGLVVEVMWGAIGNVEMTLRSNSSAVSLKYGGDAEFSFANAFSSVAVKAAYNGSQSNQDAGVTIECRQHVSGSILKPQINEWFNKFADKSFADLADVNVLKSAPDMNTSGGAPKIPPL